MEGDRMSDRGGLPPITLALTWLSTVPLIAVPFLQLG